MAKRLICVIISVLMIVSLLPTGAFATDSSEKSSDSVASVTVDNATTYYTSVTEAVSAISSSGTLTILSECDTDFTVVDGITITLDLQTDYHGDITIASGGTLIFDSTYAMMGGSVTVNGTLTVSKQQVGNTTVNSGGSITVSGGEATKVTVNSGAELTITSGSITELIVSGGTASISGGSVNEVTVNSGSLTISGGSVTESLNISGGEVSISGGTVSCKPAVSGGTLNISGSALLSVGLTISDSGTVNISGGTVTNSETTGRTITMTGGTLNITGGTISNTNTSEGGKIFEVSSYTSISITGGSFSEDVSTYLTTDYSWDETTGVVSSSVIYVAQNLTTYVKYETLQAAIDAASSGDEIKLLADVTENITIADDDNVTIDLNGYTITRAIDEDGDLDRVNSSVIKVCGTLVLEDTSEDESGKIYTCSYTDSGGTFTCSSNGGAVYVCSGGNFTLTSGTLTSDGATMKGIYGGGVYVESDATFTMNGGTITNFSINSNGTGKGDGGGVYNLGTFKMNGGTISNNTCEDFGAGVCNGGSGVFTMNGGSITGNTVASGGGSGVYNSINSTFTMTAGSISGNTTTSTSSTEASGVYNLGTMKISGSPVIDNNVSGSGVECNVLLDSGTTITLIGDLYDNASISVRTQDTPTKSSPVQITTTESGTSYYNTAISYITSDISSYVVAIDETGYLTIGCAPDVAQTVDEIGDTTGYTSLQEAIDAANQFTASVQLLTNVTEDVTISSTQSVILDLAGYTLTGDVTVRGSLEIKDSSEDGGTISGDVNVTWAYEENIEYYDGEIDSVTPINSVSATLILDNGTVEGAVNITGSAFTMNGGTISGGVTVQDGWYVDSYSMSEASYMGASFIMNDGMISNSLGTGVYLNDNAPYPDETTYSVIFTMYGGTISYCSSDKGAGVFVGDACKFTMSGGTISGNTASYMGGGIYLDIYAVFNMTDGTITENTALYGAGIACAQDYIAVTISGGTISKNTATNYGGGIFSGESYTTITMTSGSIIGNNAMYGGGVFVAYGSSFELDGGVITSNNASVAGGGVAVGTGIDDSRYYWGYGGEFTLSSGAVYNNTADTNAADIYVANHPSGSAGKVTLISASNMTETGVVFSSYAWFNDDSDSRYNSSTNVTDKVDVISSLNGEISLVAADSTFTLGISNSSNTVEAEIASGNGTAELFVKVSATSIEGSYTETAYPTTTLTYTETDFDTEETTTHSYIFAGWYSYDAESETYTACTSIPEEDAYAKFVDANVLTVKAQLAADTDSDSTTTSIRFVSTVDSLNYSSVGFKISVGSSTTSYSTTTVYKSIVGEDGSTEVVEYEPTELSSLSKYFITCILTNIPNEGFSKKITVQATWTTLDGTTVYGDAREITVNELLSAASSNS